MSSEQTQMPIMVWPIGTKSYHAVNNDDVGPCDVCPDSSGTVVLAGREFNCPACDGGRTRITGFSCKVEAREVWGIVITPEGIKYFNKGSQYDFSRLWGEMSVIPSPSEAQAIADETNIGIRKQQADDAARNET